MLSVHSSCMNGLLRARDGRDCQVTVRQSILLLLLLLALVLLVLVLVTALLCRDKRLLRPLRGAAVLLRGAVAI